MTPSALSGSELRSTLESLGVPAVAAEPLKVIVADDDPISREIVSSLMKTWGYQTLITRDGREAMEVLRAQTTPTIALLDWMMPGMDGIEVCRRVRETGKPVYLLLLTSRSGKNKSWKV